MRILLFGEYSNVHHTLQAALLRAGHEVLLISDGDGWKNYPRDIDLKRHYPGPFGSFFYVAKLFRLLPKMRGFEIVQIINPAVLNLKPHWNRWLIRYLKHNNRILSLGCYGDDYVVINRMMSDRMFQYTDFFVNGRLITHPNNEHRIRLWIERKRKALCDYATTQADCLIACLYEYWRVYNTFEYRARLHYINLPIELNDEQKALPQKCRGKILKILIGVQKERACAKGTDQILLLLERLANEYPNDLALQKVENVPFATYQRMLRETDVLVDQLYSYTPAMNALEAMAHGTVVISGGEEEYYQFIHEFELRPIINLRPFAEEENYLVLKNTLLNRPRMQQLSHESRLFIARHHNADVVASQYISFWEQALATSSVATPVQTIAPFDDGSADDSSEIQPSTTHPMHIVCATDGAYLKYCATMLISLLESNHQNAFTIHLFGNRLTIEDVSYIKTIVEDTAWHRFLFYPIEEAQLSFFPSGITDYISPMTYSRLFIGSYLPKDIHRIIYIDCDTLVLDSLRPLWDTALGDNLLAAVEDLNSAVPTLYQQLEINPSSHHYFNAGVLLINLDLWRSDSCEDKAMQIIARKSASLNYADQDVLNLLAVGRTGYLPLRYNVMEGLLREIIPDMRIDAYKDVDIALRSPAIIHFTYKLKPWNPRSFHPYKSIFYHYFDQTRWKGERPKKTLGDCLYRCAYRIGMLFHRVNLYKPIAF